MSAVFVKLVLVALIWGGTFIAGRVAAPEMSATTAALWRYIVATVALLAMVAVREGGLPRLSRDQWVGVIMLGVTGVAAYNLCFMYGLESVPASRGSLIIRGEFAVPKVSTHAWLALVYMGVLGTAVAFVWFLEGVQVLGPARAAIFVNLVPVAAIALGVLLLGEQITLAMLAGACLVVAGVWIVNRPAPAAAAPAILHPHG